MSQRPETHAASRGSPLRDEAERRAFPGDTGFHGFISMSDNSTFLSAGDISARLGVATCTITRWCAAGVALRNGGRLRLRATAVGGRWRVEPADLDRFLADLTADKTGETAPRNAKAKPFCAAPRRKGRPAK